MPLIPEDRLDEIQARVDIAELIARYVPLKRAGRHFKGLCPFHKERTPSFHVNVDKQIFHCFGCGVGGNVFSFLMRQERLTFPEAVRHLAEQAGVALPEPSEASRNGHTDQLYAIMEKTCRYYERLLGHAREGRVARAYLRKRGVTDKTRQAFRLGAAPMTGWDRLVQAAKRTNVEAGVLEQAGLVIRASRGIRDRFRQRLLFPIHDGRGRIVAFGGRSLAEQEPKYLNSPETLVYHKGRCLFGLSQAKDAIVKADEAIIVEGYFDCVVLWQHGVGHVVSPLGTALTSEQARLLSRYTRRVVLAFDADAAGEAATLRGIDVLVEAGFEVRIAQLPVGIDPDELVRSGGPQAFGQLIEQALGVFEFLIRCARHRFDIRRAEGKVHAAQFVLPTVANVQSAMLKAEYVRLLAQQLALDERAVLEELRRIVPRSLGTTSASAPMTGRVVARSPVRSQAAERMLTALVLDQPSRWDEVNRSGVVEVIADAPLRRILSVIGELRLAASDPTPAQLISRFADAPPPGGVAEDAMAAVVSELVQLVQSASHRDQAFRECLRRLQLKAHRERLTELHHRLADAQHAGHEGDVTELLKQYQRLMKENVHG